MSSMNLDTPFAETRAPAPLANEEVIVNFAEQYVNYMALEQLLHSDVYVDAVGDGDGDGTGVSSSGGSFISCQSQSSNIIASASASASSAPSDELEGRGSHQFIVRLREELTKLNSLVASNLNKIWSQVISLAQELPSLQDVPHIHDCETIIEQGRTRCDELGAELSDIYKFLNQNIKICGDLLQAADGNRYTSDSDCYQIVSNIAYKNLYFDAALCGITQIYSHIRSLQKAAQGDIEGGNGNGDAEGAMELDQIQRITHKYWLHPKDLMALKLAIAPYLPILQLDQQMQLNFGAEAVQNNPTHISQAALGMPASTKISSVYLDCSKLQSYHARLAKEDTTAVHRIRWYGKRDPNSPIQRLYIERKLHRNDWTGAINIKDRAAILQSNIFNFLVGKNNQNIPEMMRRDATSDLLLEVQDVIIERSQKPVLRSIFDRTAFQKIGDSSVRITIDSNIQMVKENTKKSWCRNLEAENLNSNEYSKFDFCVMEVKLQQEAPEWLLKIIEKSGAIPAQKSEIVPAPGFSKFLHGISVLYPEQVEEKPYWVQTQSDHLHTLNLDQMARRSSCLTSSQNPKKFEQEEDQDKHIVDFIPITNKVQSAFQIEQQLQSSSSSSSNKNRQISKNFSQLDSCKLPDTRFSPRPGQGQVQTSNSKVLIRTRVEPKVFFANERTFLSWLTVAILLVFAALSLINQQVIIIGTPETEGGEGGMLHRCKKTGRTEIQCEAGLISGALMAPVGIILIGYALYMYRKRTFQILHRSTQRYDDQLGPIILSFMLICVMMLSYALSIIAAL